MSEKDNHGFCFENKQSAVSSEMSENCYCLNSEVKLCKLLHQLNIKDPLMNGNEVTHYVSAEPSLLNQLICIVRDSEEIDLILYATNALYNLLVLHSDDERQSIIKTLNTLEHLNILTHCSYHIHLKFCEVKEYKEIFPSVQIKLLHTISTIYQVKKYRKATLTAADSTVRFFGFLISSLHTNKELMLNLLPVLKIICLQKKNNEILSSQAFFDGLYFSCKLTQKVSSVILILKLMSRSATALQTMANNKKIILLILNLIGYTGKRAINKRFLMTVLYRITATSTGLKWFLESDGFKTLYKFFMNTNSNRLAAIKAYTIMYRTLPSLQLPHIPTDDYKSRVIDKEESSEESDLDSDTSEDENQDHDIEEDTPNIFKNFDKSETYCTDNMSDFFAELTNSKHNAKLEILRELSKDIPLSRQEIIASRVFNAKHPNKQSYPDALFLNTSTEDHYLNSSTNELPLDYLGHKLMCIKGVYTNNYDSKMIYSADDQHPSEIPNLCVYENMCSNKNDQLQFESRFECGNLMYAKQIGNFDYELLLSSDTNSCNGNQWFYFQVSNMRAKTVYTFNIINFIKINSQYNYGMQPLLFSLRDYTMQGIGWRRCGTNIVYHGNNYTDESCTKQYRTLSFFLTFQYENDFVYLAYHYPYTYTRLMTFLSSITEYNRSNEIFVQVTKLCNTASCKNEVPLLTITSSNNNLNVHSRPLIFITSRVHPGETNSSWIVEGIIKFLLEKDNEVAKTARELFIFKIIPMLNPEGVISGNTRSSIHGIDLNRCWLKPNPYKCPEIYYTKKLIEYAKDVLHQPIAFYLDIHGHSRKKFFFFYGCNPTMSWNKLDFVYGDSQDILKIFPQVVHGYNTHLRLNYCKYKIQKAKESTGRVVVWREFGIRHSYTLECSYCSGAEQQTMNTQMLTDIGASIISAFASITDQAFISTKFFSSLGIDDSHFMITKRKDEENDS